MTISEQPPPPPSQQQQQQSKAASNRKRPYKPKVKTGCTSCRIRRVKCDEGKPSCQRCISTGRTCDGYEDLFRLVQWAPNQGPDEPPLASPQHGQQQHQLQGQPSKPLAGAALAGLSGPAGTPSKQKRKRQSDHQHQFQIQIQQEQPHQQPQQQQQQQQHQHHQQQHPQHPPPLQHQPQPQPPPQLPHQQQQQFHQFHQFQHYPSPAPGPVSHAPPLPVPAQAQGASHYPPPPPPPTFRVAEPGPPRPSVHGTAASTPSSTAFSPSPPVSNPTHWAGPSTVSSPSHTAGWTLASRPAPPGSTTTGYHSSLSPGTVASPASSHHAGSSVVSPVTTGPSNPYSHPPHPHPPYPTSQAPASAPVPAAHHHLHGRPTPPPAQASHAKPPSAAPGIVGPPSLTPPRLTAQDIATLAARFTNKPISEGYEVEARTTLEFSLSEPAVRHALTALQSLYKTLEDHGHEFPHGRLAVPTVYHGLQEYNNAIINLADKLAVMDRRSCEVALVCCRLFISIGTITRDYTAVAEHYIRGMRIMHEAATRPYLDARGNVIPTQNGEFPKIDIFMIKIFMSPDRMAPACKEAALAIGRRRRLPPREWMRFVRLARNEVRAARVKARLLVISKLALQHFENVSRLRPGADASKVLAEKEVLVTMLADLNLDRRDGPRQLGAYHGRFHFLYHSALTIAVKLSLWAPTDDISELKPVFERVSAVSGCVI